MFLSSIEHVILTKHRAPLLINPLSCILLGEVYALRGGAEFLPSANFLSPPHHRKIGEQKSVGNTCSSLGTAVGSSQQQITEVGRREAGCACRDIKEVAGHLPAELSLRVAGPRTIPSPAAASTTQLPPLQATPSMPQSPDTGF